MNGIEKITQRIDAETQEQIDRIMQDAQAQADKLTARFRAQADSEMAAGTARNEQSAAEHRERLISAAQMEARKHELGVRQELIDLAYDGALRRLCSLSEEPYVSILAYLLYYAAAQGRGEVIFSEKDKNTVARTVVDKVNAQRRGRLTVSEETRPLCGGFILRDGQVEINCAFDTLIRLQKHETAGTVAKRLFE